MCGWRCTPRTIFPPACFECAARASARPRRRSPRHHAEKSLPSGSHGIADDTPCQPRRRALRVFRELILRLQEAYSSKEPPSSSATSRGTGYMNALKDATPGDVRASKPGRTGARVAESIEAGESFTDFLDAPRWSATPILTRASGRHAHHASQHQGAGVRPRLSDRAGRWISTQPLHQRRKASRKNAAGVRGMTAREIIDLTARSTAHFRQRATDARFPPSRFLGEIPANWWIPCGGRWPKSANRAATSPIRVFLFLRGISAPCARYVCAERAHATAACAPTNSFSRPR